VSPPRAGRVPATRRVPTTYMNRAERHTLAQELADVKKQTGSLPGYAVRETCRQWGRSEQTVLRAVADAIANPELPKEAGLSDEALLQIAANVTNLFKTHSELVCAGLYTKSYNTFHRSWKAESLAVRIGIQFGKDAMRKAMETRVFEVPHRNAVVFLDEMVVQIPCRFGKTIYEQIYLLAFLDAYSGEVLVWDVLDTPVTAADTVALFAALVHGRVDADGVVHGGRPDVTITDNAAAFTSDLFGDFARRFTKLEFGRPYTPQDKAKIERKFWTIQYATLAGTIGTTLGPKEPGKKRRKRTTNIDDPPEYIEGQTKHWLTARHDLPTFEQAVAAVNKAVEAANALPARLTKISPSQKWAADTTVVRTVNPLLLWDAMISVGDHKVDPRGIFHYGWYRNSTNEPVKGSLSVRTLPCIKDRVFVGNVAAKGPKARERERFLAALERNSSLIEGQSDAISIRNKADAAKAGRILKGAGAALKGVQSGLPEADIEPRPTKPSKATSTKDTTRRTQVPVDLASLITSDVDLNGPVEGVVA
jgi:transposase InsO family protein